jgi:hypothetical protein
MEYYTYLYKDTLQLYRLTYYRAQRAQDKFNKQVFEY